MATSMGDSMFAKALLNVVSVVKADCIQGRAATSQIQREVFLWLSMGLFGKLICYQFEFAWFQTVQCQSITQKDGNITEDTVQMCDWPSDGNAEDSL